jgi:hypothetical protein
MPRKAATRAANLAIFQGLRADQFAFGSKQGHTLGMVPVAEKLDPVTLALLNAPVDDEPLTEAELKELEEADEEIRRGEVMTTEELKRRLGL